MKKTIRKLFAVFLVMTIFVCLTACGDDGDGKKSGGKDNNVGTYTLGEYLNSGKTLILYDGDDDGVAGKDDDIEGIYVFKDGKASYYEASYKHVSGDDGGGNVYENVLTFGDVSKMTDKEIIKKAKEQYNMRCEDFPFEIGIYTDDTGNEITYEYIYTNSYKYIDNDGDEREDRVALRIYRNSQSSAIVYESDYTGLPDDEVGRRVDYYWYRTSYQDNGDLFLDLDIPSNKTKNVVVDPEDKGLTLK